MASTSVDIGSVRPYPGAVFHAAGLEWVFYNSGQKAVYKTSFDAGVTFGLQQQVPITSSVFSLFYDHAHNRIHIAAGSGYTGGNNPIYYLSGVPTDTGLVAWGELQELFEQSDLGSDLHDPLIVCDANGCPWILYGETTVFLRTFVHLGKSSTGNGIFTTQWHITAASSYPGNTFRKGVLVPRPSSGMWIAYICSRQDAWLHPIDPDPPVLFYNTIDGNGNFSDPPTRIQGSVSNHPTAGLRVGADMHIVWPDGTSGSILHAVNTNVKVVQAGITDTPRLMHDIPRNRLLCFWTSGNHIYYKAYDLTTGTWDAEPTDWLNETAYGGINSALVLDFLNESEYERFPMAYGSQSYVRFALSDLQPPTVRTLPGVRNE